MALLGLVASGMGVAVVTSSYQNILSDFIDYRVIKEPAINIDIEIVHKKSNESIMVKELLKVAQEIKTLNR